MVAVMAMWGGIAASAQTVSQITLPKVSGWKQGQSLVGETYTDKTSNVTVSFSKGSGTDTPTYNTPKENTTENYAILAVGNTMTLSTPNNVITKVAFQFTPVASAAKASDFTPSGTYVTNASGEKTKYVWTGKTQKLVLKNVDNTNGIKVGRIYLTVEAAPITITTKDGDFSGVAECTLTNDNKFIIEESNVAALDMTNVKLDPSVTELNFANPNMILKVPGTISGSIGKLNEDSNWKNIKDVNMVVISGNACAAVLGTARFVDTDGCAVLTTRHFTAKNGCIYTRTIKAGAWATSVLPATATNLPFDAYVVDADNSTGDNVVFKKVDTVEAYTPFLIHNTSSNEITWTIDIKGTNNVVDMRCNNAKNTIKTVSTTCADFTGTFNITDISEIKEKTDKENIVVCAITSQSSSNDNVLTLKKIGSNKKIGAFRAYFMLNTATNSSAVNFSFIGGDPTDVEGLKDVLGIQHPANVYNINGQVVKTGATTLDGLDKGIYLFNGKKYVVK